MSKPSDGSRGPAQKPPSEPARKHCIVPAQNLLRSRLAKPRHELASSVSISMAVHAAFLFILSWIYFDLPHREILDSMLSLVVANPQTATEIVEINAPDAAEPTDEPGEIAGWNGAIELPGEAADLASVTFDSDSFQVSDRTR
jgi:hypothetical protein